MRIRSLTELNEHLDNELSWRKKELTTLRLLIGSLRDHQKKVFLRAIFCILYAHWEGFIKAAATSYISYVETRGLKFRELTANFIALGIRGKIIEAGTSKRATLHTSLTSYLLSELSDPARMGADDAIDTESNLNSRVLSDILCAIGIDDKTYATKSQLLDQKLLYVRNTVAHGTYYDVDEADYEDLHDQIVHLIQQFRTDVENAAVLEKYRR